MIKKVQAALRDRVPRLLTVLTVGFVAFALASFQGGLCEDDKAEALIDKADRLRQAGEPVNAQEQDILEIVAKRPLGTQVKAKDGSWKLAKYGDPKLAAAVEHLASIPKPWTVSSITQKYHALKGKNDQTCAHLLRVLAASRDPRAATVLGPALSDGSLAIRVAATYGIMDYFMDHPVNGGTEQHMEAAQQWWQQQQTKAKAK